MSREPLIIFTKEEVEALDLRTLQNYAWSWTQALGYGENALRWIKAATEEELKNFCIARSPSAHVANKKCCSSFVAPSMARRPANALNIEIGQPAPRCTLKTPWDGLDGATWIFSGGSPFVLGRCDSVCPKASR